jgi:gamma-glutamyltranspeptidase
LNILAQYGAPSGISGPLGIHREIEALKHAFAVRMNLGDPDFINVTEVVSDMLSPKFAEMLKKTIYDNMTFDPRHYGGRYATSFMRVWMIYMIITVSTKYILFVSYQHKTACSLRLVENLIACLYDLCSWQSLYGEKKIDVHMFMC